MKEGEDELLPPAPAQEGCRLLVSRLAKYRVIEYAAGVFAYTEVAREQVYQYQRVLDFITGGGTITRFPAY